MNREALIGLFVLAALAVMAYFVIRTSDLSGALGGDGEKTISVVLDDASGIRKGTPVRVAGVEVGRVRELRLEDGKAIAVISTPNSLTFREGARAKLENQGVLGERFISLELGSGAEADPDQLVGQAPPGLTQITTTLNQLGENLLAISESLKQSTTTNQGDNRIAIIAENIERLTETLVLVLEENRGNFTAVSTEIASLSASLNRDIPPLVAELSAFAKELRTLAAGNRGELDRTIKDVSAISANMSEASESLSSIAQKVDQGEGTIGRLVNEGDTVDKLNSLLDSANESLGEVKKLVDRATDLDVDLTFSSQYLAEHGGARSYFGVVIRPNDQKYYRLEGVVRETDYLPVETTIRQEQTFDPDGALLATTIFREDEEADDFVFNGQLAYRFGDVFLKGGLFESEAGAGLEYYGLDDRLRFSIEGYDFSREMDLSPHAKVDFLFKLEKHIAVQVGYDDFLESDLRSAFVGAGIRWKDEDLKLLLTNVGRFLR